MEGEKVTNVPKFISFLEGVIRKVAQSGGVGTVVDIPPEYLAPRDHDYPEVLLDDDAVNAWAWNNNIVLSFDYDFRPSVSVDWSPAAVAAIEFKNRTHKKYNRNRCRVQ